LRSNGRRITPQCLRADMKEYRGWREMIDLKEFGAVALGVILITTVIMCLATSCVEKHAKKCESKGGVYHWSRDGSLCLKKDAVL
jgi:hypothetical protein